MAASNALNGSRVARVVASLTAVTLDADGGYERRSLAIFNESTGVLYVKHGPAVTVTDYTVQVLPGQFYELPQPIYRGIVTGLWSIADGAAQVTEGY